MANTAELELVSSVGKWEYTYQSPPILAGRRVAFSSAPSVVSAASPTFVPRPLSLERTSQVFYLSMSAKSVRDVVPSI